MFGRAPLVLALPGEGSGLTLLPGSWQLRPTNVRALYRRAEAHMELGTYSILLFTPLLPFPSPTLARD